ncbi:MAG: type VI secretion system baseplate subunit TssG [Rhodospirillales bacterium]|nr:type VI secretion system baseplate subunit TssG [Rhodospirillales bacterium]
MAAVLRRNSRPLIEHLNSEPQGFHILQALRLLERLHPGCVPIGSGGHPALEAVRFVSQIDMAFPASDIDSLEFARGASASAGEMTQSAAPQTRMRVNFLGLAGAFGPLPSSISERTMATARAGNTATRDFLDIFNHRLVSLFCRLHRSRLVAMQPGLPAEGHTAAVLFAILGLGTAGLRQTLPPVRHSRMGGAERSLLAPAGLLARRPASLHALERLAAHYLDLPVRGAPLQGRWLHLDPGQRTAIGYSGRNRALGTQTVLGGRTWDQQAALRLDLGPMPLSRALEFLPRGSANRSLRALLGFAVGDSVDVELRLIVAKEEVEPVRLSHRQGARLGWTSWLGTRPRQQHGVVALRLPCTTLSSASAEVGKTCLS